MKTGKMIAAIFFMMMFFGSTDLFAEKLAQLPEITKPYRMRIQNNRIFVAAGGSRWNVFIYSLKDFKHIKTFGKKGEGPGEYLSTMDLKVTPKWLAVNTEGKLMFFTHDGAFSMERGTYPNHREMTPIGENYVALIHETGKGNKSWVTDIVLLDKNLKVQTKLSQLELPRAKTYKNGKRDLLVFQDQQSYEIYEDRIYVGATPKGFFFEVFDGNGKSLYTIEKTYKRRKVTSAHKDTLLKSLGEGPGGERRKKQYNPVFPEYFPAYDRFFVNDGRIYVYIYNRSNKGEKENGKDHVEIISLDLKGKELARNTVPVAGIHHIYGGKYYYLKENEAEEEWELHMAPLK